MEKKHKKYKKQHIHMLKEKNIKILRKQRNTHTHT